MHMGVYSCKKLQKMNGMTYYHITSWPERQKEARREVREEMEKREREAFVEEALDQMYEKAEREDVIPWNDAELEETFPEDMGITPPTLPIVNERAFPEEGK